MPYKDPEKRNERARQRRKEAKQPALKGVEFTESDAEEYELEPDAEPVDVAEKGAPPTATDKAIKALKDMFTYHPEAPKKPKRTFFQRQAGRVAGLMVNLMSSLWPEDWTEPFEVAGEERQVAPTKADYERVLSPLARIADRHVELSIDNPDWEDAGSAIWALGEIVFTMRANHALLRKLIEQEQQRSNAPYGAYTATQQAGSNGQSVTAQVIDYSSQFK